MALGRYRQNPLGQGRRVRLMQGDIGEQGPNGDQTGIAGANTVAPLMLEMIEEVADEVGVDILEGQILRRLAENPVGVVDEQPERTVSTTLRPSVVRLWATSTDFASVSSSSVVNAVPSAMSARKKWLA